MTAFDGTLIFRSSCGRFMATVFRVEDSQKAFFVFAIAPSTFDVCQILILKSSTRHMSILVNPYSKCLLHNAE